MVLVTRVAVGGVLVLALAGVACAAEEPVAQAYTRDFQQARELATSQFERDVLADDVITREEYEEAMQRYVRCMADSGLTVGLIDQQGYYGYEVPGNGEAYDRTTDQCSQGTNALIEGLYVEVLTNPDKLDYDEMIARCFVKAGLVDEPFSAQDFDALMKASGAGSYGDAPGESVPIDPRAQEIMNSEDAAACMANPNRHQLENQ